MPSHPPAPECDCTVPIDADPEWAASVRARCPVHGTHAVWCGRCEIFHTGVSYAPEQPAGVPQATVERAIFELNRIPEYAYQGHTPTCQGEPGCPLCRALDVLRNGYDEDGAQ